MRDAKGTISKETESFIYARVHSQMCHWIPNMSIQELSVQRIAENTYLVSFKWLDYYWDEHSEYQQTGEVGAALFIDTRKDKTDRLATDENEGLLFLSSHNIARLVHARIQLHEQGRFHRDE